MSKNKHKNAKPNNKEKDNTKKNKSIQNKRAKNDKNIETNKTEKGKKKGFWKRHRKLALFIKICMVLMLLLIIVGAGAVVTKNIDESVTVVGCPARPIGFNN